MKSIIFALITSTFLIGCDKVAEPVNIVEKPSTSKTAVLGIEFTAATKGTISKAFSDANIGFIESINKWEEKWTSGGLYPDATAIRIGFTEAGKLAYFQYDFNDQEQARTSNLQGMVIKQFGEPTGFDGELDSGGEYTANWELGDGIRVQVKRTYPDKNSHLTYFNDPVFEVLKLEYAIKARADAQADAEKVGRIF